MIFQEPMTALNPVHRIGRQLSEAFLLHQRVRPRTALERSRRGAEAGRHSLARDPRQRVPAPALRRHAPARGDRHGAGLQPALVIADEPTTALDVTIQAQILELMKQLQEEMGMSIILITHDLGVIAETCDDVLVMYAGRVAEQGTVDDVFHRPAHPYTRGLLASIPRLEYPRKTRLRTIEGMVPGLMDLPAGCRFNNRCPHAEARCLSEVRHWRPAVPRRARRSACHRWRQLAPSSRSRGA
jgi:oligopeptide/dipeptide ABC transporter ATP-binding protein